MVELAEIVPFIGFAVAVAMPIVLKKLDFGESARIREEQKEDTLEQRLSKIEAALARRRKYERKKTN